LLTETEVKNIYSTDVRCRGFTFVMETLSTKTHFMNIRLWCFICYKDAWERKKKSI